MCRYVACEKDYKLRESCDSFTRNLKWTGSNPDFSGLGEQCRELLNKTEVLKRNVANLQSEDFVGIEKIYQEFCQIHTKLTTILKPDTKEVIESGEFFHALVSKLYGNWNL